MLQKHVEFRVTTMNGRIVSIDPFSVFIKPQEISNIGDLYMIAKYTNNTWSHSIEINDAPAGMGYILTGDVGVKMCEMMNSTTDIILKTTEMLTFIKPNIDAITEFNKHHKVITSDYLRNLYNDPLVIVECGYYEQSPF